MIIKGVRDYDISNFKIPCLFIAFPYCTFKCEKECGMQVCQNSTLATSPNIDISTEKLIEIYDNNPLTKAVVMGGLEPFDSFEDILKFLSVFREKHNDVVVIYTGYNKGEIQKKIACLVPYKNIIIKYGRFIPNDTPRYDDILGVELASHNQYAEVIC